MTDVPDLPNFSRFHDVVPRQPEGNDATRATCARPSSWPTTKTNCEFVKLNSPEIDERLKDGPELVSANFVIPYPPGFPIMVPGQVHHAGHHHLHAQARREGNPRLRRAQGIKLLESRRARQARQRRMQALPTLRRADVMQAFFHFLADEPVHPAVLHRRHGGAGSASSRSRATASAWSPRPSWSARRSRPGPRPTASSCSSTTSPSRSSTTCSCTASACASARPSSTA